MSYSTAKDCWSGLSRYDLSGKKTLIEEYVPRVTLSLQEWQKYIEKGSNVLLPGIIPNGTVQTMGGLQGAVYTGTQGKASMYK
jgi:hypothetical protein